MAASSSTSRRPVRRPGGFTLTELLIAIAVLVGVLLAVSKIFSTTSKVTGAGQATADVLAEIPAIEWQIRRDIERLSREGFFAIRNVAIPNDVNGATLLNPTLDPTAIIRADQLVFFTQGVQSAQSFRQNAGSSRKGQGSFARIYYGHGYQLPGADGFQSTDVNTGLALDASPEVPVFPWTTGDVDMVRTRYSSDTQSGQPIFRSTPTDSLRVAPIDARQWLLVRQPVLLVDDDAQPIDGNSKTVYLDEVLTARSVFLKDPRPELGFTPQVYHGRVDAAATELDTLRQLIQTNGNQMRPWSGLPGGGSTQFDLIASDLVYYPRAERVAPSMNRVDQSLTSNVLGTACSSIKIEWTYRWATGATYIDRSQTPAVDQTDGLWYDEAFPQPWFGFPDPERGVAPYGDEIAWQAADTIFPQNVERRYPVGNNVAVYEAFFGFNQVEALDASGNPNVNLGYTPWPSAIRVTLTLHDSRNTLEVGREVQFVIDLPKRAVSR